MPSYLLSVHTGASRSPSDMSEEERQRSYERVAEIEHDLRASGAWVFSGRLTGPDDAAVIRAGEGTVTRTDGPFVETKEQLGGFYIISTDEPQQADAWAARVSEAIGQPIEVRPFFAHS
jgi:hypothetical protein